LISIGPLSINIASDLATLQGRRALPSYGAASFKSIINNMNLTIIEKGAREYDRGSFLGSFLDPLNGNEFDVVAAIRLAFSSI